MNKLEWHRVTNKLQAEIIAAKKAGCIVMLQLEDGRIAHLQEFHYDGFHRLTLPNGDLICSLRADSNGFESGVIAMCWRK